MWDQGVWAVERAKGCVGVCDCWMPAKTSQVREGVDTPSSSVRGRGLTLSSQTQHQHTFPPTWWRGLETKLYGGRGRQVMKWKSDREFVWVTDSSNVEARASDNEAEEEAQVNLGCHAAVSPWCSATCKVTAHSAQVSECVHALRECGIAPGQEIHTVIFSSSGSAGKTGANTRPQRCHRWQLTPAEIKFLLKSFGSSPRLIHAWDQKHLQNPTQREG